MCPIISDWRKQPFLNNFRVAKNNRSKSVWTLFQRKRLNNQTVWPVIFGITGPIWERALKSLHLLELRPRGHHDWPVMPTTLQVTARFWRCESNREVTPITTAVPRPRVEQK